MPAIPDNHKKKLLEIKSEVNELHPLLKKLFRNMPSIKNVEYSHGPNEMGADFVLSSLHESLQMEKYIAVIAKVGTVKQNNNDIERQIKECQVSRPIFGGKRYEKIDEIWVVTNGTISNGFQKNINAHYNSIYFIDIDMLSGFIDKYLPNFWLELDLNISDYLSNVASEMEILDRRYSLSQVEDNFYIKQNLVVSEEKSYLNKQKHRANLKKFDVFEEISKRKNMFIQGGMGSGKSKMLRQIAKYYSKPEVYQETGILPCLTTFREVIEDYNGDINKLLEGKLYNKFGDSTDYADSKVLVLIDAIDEKDLPFSSILSSIEKIVEDVTKDNKLKAVFASRYFGRLYKEGGLRDVNKYDIEPLSIRKIVDFLQHLCRNLNIRSRLIEDMKRSPLFKQLPKNPIAAILLAQIINDNTQDLPANLTELYSKYMELVLGRWDISKGLQSQKEYNILLSVLMMMAEYMIESEVDWMPDMSQEKSQQVTCTLGTWA